MKPPTRRRTPSVSVSIPASADLHVHTTHSDGSCTPGDVVRSAASVGLTALAITDHDTLTALAVARPEAVRLGLELVGGIELTAVREAREIHLLGHFVRDDDPKLVAVTAALRVARSTRIVAMSERLQALGLWVDLLAIRRTFPRATLGRKHLADWLCLTGQVENAREAFAKYLGDDGPASVAKMRVPWREAIALIRGAGGVAGLAHPPYDLRQSTLDELCEGGLGSIEVAGPGINPKLGLRWREWAEARGLVPIAGSDFHAPDRPGRWVGAIVTPGEDLERLRAARVSEGLQSPFRRGP